MDATNTISTGTGQITQAVSSSSASSSHKPGQSSQPGMKRSATDTDSQPEKKRITQRPAAHSSTSDNTTVQRPCSSVKASVDTAAQITAVASSVRKDPSANNTVIFAIDKSKLSAPEMNTGLDHTTAAATISINGEPITFYIRWGFNSKACAPFLVAKGSDFKSQTTEITPEKIAAFSKMFGKPPNLNDLLDKKFVNAFQVTESGFDFVIDNLLDDAKCSLGQHEFSLSNHPTAKLQEEIQIQPYSNEATNRAFNWKKQTVWSLHLTNKEGDSLARLSNITFQDEAHTYLWDGHAMDGWRIDELKSHARQAHHQEVAGNATFDDLKSAFLLMNPACDPCFRIFEQNEQKKKFWNEVETALTNDDTPEQLQFRVSITPKAV